MITRRPLVPILALLLLPAIAQALPPDRDSRPARHYILESDVPLDAVASAELAAEGIDVQQPLANHRYLVRMRDDVAPPHDARIRSIRSYDASRKIARAAYAEAAQGKAFARLQIVFQKEVTFDEARKAIDAVGGTIDTPFRIETAAQQQRLTVRIPSGATMTLAEDERVFGVYGPPLHPHSLNAVAAQLSKVTPLYSAPYNLNGEGVVLSIFEPDGPPDVAHPEFGGRLVNHFDASRPVNDHATHVSGTMIAAGINASAKGMAPRATLHAFDAGVDFDVLLKAKQNQPESFGSVADNNSWDYAVSWQFDGSCAGNVPCVWYANEDALGAYSGLESEPYDEIIRRVGTPLLVHAAGNDADSGMPVLTMPWSPHKHFNYTTNKVDTGTFCYSQNGSGTDCETAAPFRCSTGKNSEGDPYCETTKHATHGANTTIGLMASTKNTVTVGAVQSDGVSIASFSSRGPTTDGRIKPELVAKGTNQFSTFPNNGYATIQGTSMATPVVTGIAGMVTQQFRQTFGKTPDGSMLKTLLIAGADDLGNAGPDYTFGFGLVDAKASVDLIRADNGSGTRIRTGTIGNGQQDIPITLVASQKLRVVLGWFDPEVLLQPNPQPNDDDLLAGKTLINDLDLSVIDSAGNTVLPYVLNPASANAAATRGVNHTDTTEEVEIANAIPGTYHIIVHGLIGDARSSTQDYVLIANGGSAPCTDNYEPNDTQATAVGLANAVTITPKICSASDVDYFTFTSNAVAVTVTTTDTPVKVTLMSSMTPAVSTTIAPNSSGGLDASISSMISPIPMVPFYVRIEANGPVGASGAYTLTPAYTFTSAPRKRATKR